MENTTVATVVDLEIVDITGMSEEALTALFEFFKGVDIPEVAE